MSHIQPDPNWTRPVIDAETFDEARDNLAHTLEIFSDDDDDRMVLMATSNVYGPGIKTGLTMGDLRLIARTIGAIQ